MLCHCAAKQYYLKVSYTISKQSVLLIYVKDTLKYVFLQILIFSVDVNFNVADLVKFLTKLISNIVHNGYSYQKKTKNQQN